MSSSKPGVGKALSLLAGFVAVSVVAGVLAAGVFMPAVGASGSLARNSVAFFDALPSVLEQPPLSEQSTVLASDGSLIAHFYEENRTEVPLSEMSPLMQQAIVAIEDSRFYEHGGVDPRGVVRAAVTNQLTNETQGASTLTQQLVKNILLEKATAAGDRAAAKAAIVKSNSRKLQEMKYAISLEKQYDKKEILQRYLNIAYFGDRTYGVEAAARYYFGTSAAKLNLAESATLAGIVQAPGKYSPRVNPLPSEQRRNVVLARMLQLGMVPRADYEKARATPLKVKLVKPRNGCYNAKDMGYFCDYVRGVITRSSGFEALGKTERQRQDALYRGGLTIKTTIDPKLQKAAVKAVMQQVPPKDKSRLGAAAVTVQPGTGRILAMAQNRIYSTSNTKGQTAVNYNTDSKYGGSNGFQTGSTFKMFTLATWLSKGKSLRASVDASKRALPFSAFRACGAPVGGGVYKFANASEGEGKGSMSVYNATVHSVNTAFVEMERQLDLCDIANVADKLGVHRAAPAQGGFACGSKKPTTKLPTCYPSLTLGPIDLAPLTMANAYASFAAGGIYCSPTAIDSIKDRDGKKIKIAGSKCSQAVSADVARGVTFAGRGVITSGTARGNSIGRPAAGKTGTTNGPKDSWFVGYTPQLSTAVWVADPGRLVKGQLRRKTLRGLVVDGRYRPIIFGATIAAPIWRQIMLAGHRGLPVKNFQSPSARLLRVEGGLVPNVNGQPVPAAVAALIKAGFQAKVSGSARSKYPAGTVASTSPGAGSRLAKGSTVTITVSTGRKRGGNGPPGTKPR